jgi:hypothetical protein
MSHTAGSHAHSHTWRRVKLQAAHSGPLAATRYGKPFRGGAAPGGSTTGYRSSRSPRNFNTDHGGRKGQDGNPIAGSRPLKHTRHDKAKPCSYCDQGRPQKYHSGDTLNINNNNNNNNNSPPQEHLHGILGEGEGGQSPGKKPAINTVHKRQPTRAQMW